ncbi:hypothetical protein D3C72_2035410 [compost metagenome]
MLAQIVFIQQGLLHIRKLWRQLAAEDPHIGDLFQHDGVMHRILGVFAPRKRPVRVHQHARHLRRIDSRFFKGFDDHVARFPLILAVNFRIGHFTGAGDGAVKIVGMGRACRRNGLSCLRPDGGVARVGMHDTANRRE